MHNSPLILCIPPMFKFAVASRAMSRLQPIFAGTGTWTSGGTRVATFATRTTKAGKAGQGEAWDPLDIKETLKPRGGAQQSSATLTGDNTTSMGTDDSYMGASSKSGSTGTTAGQAAKGWHQDSASKRGEEKMKSAASGTSGMGGDTVVGSTTLGSTFTIHDGSDASSSFQGSGQRGNESGFDANQSGFSAGSGQEIASMRGEEKMAPATSGVGSDAIGSKTGSTYSIHQDSGAASSPGSSFGASSTRGDSMGDDSFNQTRAAGREEETHHIPAQNVPPPLHPSSASAAPSSGPL